MTALDRRNHDHETIETTLAQDSRVRYQALQVGRFLLHLLEMLLAMGLGMGLFHLLASLIPAWSSLAAATERGTTLHAIAMTVFMTVPMLAWMMVRGHGWRHSAEMGIAMLAPMAAVFLLCQLGGAVYLPWLSGAGGPAMYVGMLAAMIYRRDHYTRHAGHSGHAAHLQGETAKH